MRLFRDYRGVPEAFQGMAVAIGNFDGVHRGHQALLAACRAEADRLQGPFAALTFEPHPRRVFSPDAPPFRLTPFRSRVRRLRAEGVEALFTLRFDEALHGKPAARFVQDVLVDGLGARHVVVGYDFVFGHQRDGDVDVLRRAGETHGFGVTVLEPVTHGDDVCSSTIARVNLESGRVRRAAELMGAWWEVEGRVRGGDRRGRTIGFPTLNLHLDADALKPSLGVYAVQVSVLREDGSDEWHPGAANLGRRPTFDGTGVVLEVHILDYSGDLYGRRVRVAFVEHLRPERKFDGLESLKAQIDADCEEARQILARPENAATLFEAEKAAG